MDSPEAALVRDSGSFASCRLDLVLDRFYQIRFAHQCCPGADCRCGERLGHADGANKRDCQDVAHQSCLFLATLSSAPFLARQTALSTPNCVCSELMVRELELHGYDAIIGREKAPVGEILKQNGYATSWFGKNHNTQGTQYSLSGPFDQWPSGMGFDYFYGFMGGETDQWRPWLFRDHDRLLGERVGR
jgi:hypothetical protein